MARTHVIDAGSAGKVIAFRSTITTRQALKLVRQTGELLSAAGVAPEIRTAAFGTVLARLLARLGCRHLVRIPVPAYWQAVFLLPQLVAVAAGEVRQGCLPRGCALRNTVSPAV